MMVNTRSKTRKRPVDPAHDDSQIKKVKHRKRSGRQSNGQLPRPPIEALPAELMLKVFGDLEVLDLTRCQRVCKRWKGVMLEDKGLRETLWLDSRLQPVDLDGMELTVSFNSRNIEDEDEDADERDCRPTPKKIFYLSEDHIPPFCDNDGLCKSDCFSPPLSLPISFPPEAHEVPFRHNPLLTRLERFLRYVNPNFKATIEFLDGSKTVSALLFRNPKHLREQLRQRPRYRSDGWRNMLMTQPPILSLDVRMEFENHWPFVRGFKSNGFDTVFQIDNPSGVTLGQFIEVIQQYLAEDVEFGMLG
ncbi:hypothetical protein BDV96DRAFT_565430 [Lophiotrema nucula]|uniref:F-box domain-containing protein n=1 Tax=Lophiotrema nucula TaxID=690887 RepID=A0A6A5ZMV6_9PLEO|nr:hypothetical protein BDV96DRAFT_565430 [Lophiotrema nucula]